MLVFFLNHGLSKIGSIPFVFGSEAYVYVAGVPALVLNEELIYDAFHNFSYLKGEIAGKTRFWSRDIWYQRRKI
jgi:hypothetical protein